MYVTLKRNALLYRHGHEATPSQSVNPMTYVLLTCDDDEKTIEFPTQPTFTAHLARIRQLEPDRRWQITEEWDR